MSLGRSFDKTKQKKPVNVKLPAKAHFFTAKIVNGQYKDLLKT